MDSMMELVLFAIENQNNFVKIKEKLNKTNQEKLAGLFTGGNFGSNPGVVNLIAKNKQKIMNFFLLLTTEEITFFLDLITKTKMQEILFSFSEKELETFFSIFYKMKNSA